MSAALAMELMIPPRILIGDVAARLTKILRLHEKNKTRMRRTYYDSFDWRLYRKGLAFLVEGHAHRYRLLCMTVRNGHIQDTCALETSPPRFVWDLPDRRLRERLTPILEMRALLPQAAIELAGQRFVSSDNALHLLLANCCAIRNGRQKPMPLGHWLIVEAAHDAQEPLCTLLTDLGNEFGLEHPDIPLLQQALTTFGKQPQDPAQQPDLALNPAQRADHATKTILRRLLSAMEINEAGVLQRTDSEFLHDYRIAVRRTRSALGQIKRVFPERTVKRFAPPFAWLGQVTGVPRDLDVYLLGFDELKANLPPTLRDGLDPLRVFLERRADLAHAELARQLASRRYRMLMASWKTFLDAPVPGVPHAANARMPIHELANQRIWKIYRRALKQGRAIQPHSPAERLHELRKTCKKLRYLLEFFQSLYPVEKIKPLIKQLKGFQNHLGAFQDVHAQIDTLHRFSLDMRRMTSVPTDTLLAMGALLGQLDQHQIALRGSFAESFAQFAREDNRVRFSRLFSPSLENGKE